MRPADMFSKVVLTDYPRTMRTLDSRLCFVFESHTLSRTCSSFKCLRKVVEMIISKGPSSKGSRASSIGFGSLDTSSVGLGYLRSSLRTMTITCSRNISSTSNRVLSRGKVSRILFAVDAKGIECSKHLNTIVTGNHLSKKSVTYKVLTGSKGHKVGSIIATAKTFWNDVMSFCVSFRKVGLTMFNNSVVPSCVFV